MFLLRFLIQTIMRYLTWILLYMCPFLYTASATDTLRIDSKVFGDQRPIRIELPGEYVNNPWRKYPVVFLLDGHSRELFDFTWGSLQYLTGMGYLSPVILIGIPHTNRQFELTPPAITATGRKQFQKSGGADSLLAFLTNELMPVLNRQYRCTDYRIGIGHSLGGSFLIHAMLQQKPLFKATIAVSPNLEFDEMQSIRRFTAALPRQFEHRFLYFCYGAGDKLETKFKPATVALDSVLQHKRFQGLQWASQYLPGLHHGVTPLNGIPDGLVRLSQHLSLPYEELEQLMKDSSTPIIKRLQQYYLKASQSSGMVLPTVHEANIHAYNLYYSERTADAAALLRWAIELHPEDVNLHDSLGEMLQKSGDKKGALSAYQSAKKLVERYRSQLPEAELKHQLKWFGERIDSVK